jgi:hypothetical protein
VVRGQTVLAEAPETVEAATEEVSDVSA